MSWMKRGQAGAGAGAGTQPYVAPQAQPFANQQNMYSNYQGSTGATAPQPQPQQQQYWQMPPQQPIQQPPQQSTQQPPQQQYNHSQQYGQAYPQEYPPNANQYQPPAQTQYNQNYANQYPSPPQNYQQNYYQHQPTQQKLPPNYTQNAVNTGTGNADGWEDNWDWGWEENAKKAQSMQSAAQQPPVQQQVFNNANVIEESFASTDSWNWAMDEKKESKAPAAVPPPSRQENNEPATLPIHSAGHNVVPNPAQHNISSQQAEEVKTLSDREVIKERLPNLALGKRIHLENLTPQWSIESQMSQESSDGPQTQSEGTYRSENQSRNSGESPGPNSDNSNFNYAHPGFDETYTQNSEWSKNSDEPTVADGCNSRRESHGELSTSLREMSITNDHHSANSVPALSVVASQSIHESLRTQPPPTISPANFPPPVTGSVSAPSMSMPPPPPASSLLPQLPPQAAPLPSLPRPPSSSSTSSLGYPAPVPASPPQPPPASSPAALPPSLPPPSNSQNPFQRAGPFSHKSTSKSPSVPPQPFQPQTPSSNLASPAAVNKVSQSRGPGLGFEANLETTPDNSERPDQPQVPFRAMPLPQSIPDNMEVAPQNDRNEYLQTAHLSSGDYGENTDFTRNLPPPGLRRMVVGQQEPEYQNLNMSGDEPPPGLSRMVPGQQTEADNAYNQPSDNYMDRHIDGQPMDNAGSARPFRQADGQQNPDNYSQPVTARANDRRPVGFDRMVPGEPSNDEYSQYQSSNYGSNEQRVVTGVDHDFPIHIEAGPSDVREQNMDGSDYTEPAPRNVIGAGAGARETLNEVTQDFVAPDETQREVTMEGENLQDLSVISSADLAYSREHLDGADQNTTDGGADGNDASDPVDRPATSSRKQSLIRHHSSGDDSERDRAFKASPRRDRHKTSRDRDRDRNRDRDKEGRYSRGDRSDRKYDRDDRRRDDKRTDKDRRDRAREGDASPDARKHRRTTRSRKYEEDDTDYYSDRERDRRRYRENSYPSKPPRPEDRDRRYNTVDRERRERPRDSTRRDRDRDRYDKHYNDYRDIDPSRKYGNLHREREEERRRVTFSTDAKSNDSKSEGDTFSSASRPESREAGATDEEAPGARRGQPRARRPRHHRAADLYYDGYGGSGYQDPYALQRQQYEYYEQLRVTDPAQYMLVYKQLMAGHVPAVPRDLPRNRQYAAGEGYPSLGYEGQERGSVHSGRSSTTGLKGNDTFYVYRHDAASLRDAPSLRTDVSDRDLNTEASLGLQLDGSTVRSERMTPFRYSTAHIKGSIGSRDIVVVPAAYPADGRPGAVRLLSLAAATRDPAAAELLHSPGPLLTGVTHKKSVIEYCMVRVRNASREGARDVIGYVLVWELLALMLRQNGVVVGTDIAELVMKNVREYEHKCPSSKSPRAESRRASSLSGSQQEDSRRSSTPPLSGAQQNDYSLSDTMGVESLGSPCVDEKTALDKFREYLLYGNRQEALEWAMSNNLWGHALQLAAGGERRTRAAVSARFLCAVPRADPLHTLYASLAHAAPPAATCVSDERWGEWRTHVAMLLANSSARPEQDARSLTTLGDSLASRGLPYSAQFCYVSCGVPFARHPLAPLPPGAPPAAPPRLSLLLAPPRPATLAQLATTGAILATEIYEYARSLNSDYVIDELQVYKLVAACRLVDAGQYARALAYVESAARAVTCRASRAAPHPPHAPHAPHEPVHSPRLVRALADLADRLKYHDPALSAGGAGGAGAGGGEEGADSGEGSPGHHHQWLDDVKNLAHMLQAESASQQVTPQHQYSAPQNHYSWGDQAQQYQQTPNQSYAEPEATADYSQYYQPTPSQPLDQHQADPPSPYIPPPGPPAPAPAAPYASPDPPGTFAPAPAPPELSTELSAQEESPQYHYEDWSRTEETHSQSYGEPYWQGDAGYAYGESAGERPAISMPGSARADAGAGAGRDDDRPPSAQHTDREDTPKSSKDGKSKEMKTDNKGRSWIGGILTKLSLRPPNQMILPDDKNPTIVWDADKQRWRNTDGGEEETERAPPPPPRMQDLPHRSASPPLQGAPPPPAAPHSAAPVSNIFKMQKGRHIKKSYVDVFNPSGAALRPRPPAAEVLGPAPPPAAAAQNYFVPAPAHTGPYEADDDQYPRSGI